MNNKPVIFHISKWYPNRYDSLLGVFVKRHVLSTLPYTTPVLLYAMAAELKGKYYTIEESVEEGICTYRAYYSKNITGIRGLDNLLKSCCYAWLVFKLYTLATQKFGKPDLIHAHILLRTAVMARLFNVLYGTPYVLMEHSSSFIREEIRAFKNCFSLAIARHVVKKAKAVMTVSICLGEAMKQRYALKNNRYEVVYNCVDTNVFTFVQPHEHKQSNVKTLLYVAEFDNVSKNITGLLSAIAELSVKRSDFRLTMVGYGKDEFLLHRHSEQLGIKNKNVFFRGKLSSLEVASEIQHADALLLFSNFETLSCIVTESLCCGTPVITTAVGGVVEIVNSTNGILIPKGDEKAMQDAIEKVLDNEITVDRKKISSDAVALFSNRAVGEKMMGIYKTGMAC